MSAVSAPRAIRPPVPAAAPRAAGRHLELALLSVYWVALGYLWQGLHIAILPQLVEQMVGTAHKASALALLENLGLAVAVLWQPIAGGLSDRARTRWGRRRPFLVVGTLGDLVFLAGIALSGAYWVVVLSYVLLQFSSNTAHGPYQSLLPDIVPDSLHGTASGYYGLASVIGVAAGVGGVGAVHMAFGYQVAISTIGVVLVLAMLATVVLVREPEPLPSPAKARWWRVVSDCFTTPLQDRNFLWLTASRLILLAGLTGIQTYAFYFFSDAYFAGTPERGSLIATYGLAAVLVIFAVAATFPAGRLADRVGKRRVLVISGLLVAAGTMALVFSHLAWLPYGLLQSLSRPLGIPPLAVQALVVAVPMAIGTGACLSAGWALMTALVPKPAAGQFMGFFNIATAGGGIASRLAGGALLDTFNGGPPILGLPAGYPFLFALCSGLVLVGTLAVLKVREPRQRARSRDPSGSPTLAAGGRGAPTRFPGGCA